MASGTFKERDSESCPDAPYQAVIRVLALIDGYAVSGAPKAILEFARQASRTDLGLPHVELVVLTYTRGDIETDFIRALRADGISVEVVKEKRRFDPGVLHQLRSAVERHKPDLLWTNGVKSHFLVRAARLNRDLPWIAFHHGYTATDWVALAYNQLDRWSLRGPNQVMTVCRAFCADLNRRSGVPLDWIKVQHMPIRPSLPVTVEESAQLRRELELHPGTHVILAVGRLSKEKGHADLIHALAHIRKNEPSLPLRLLILGDGPERSRLEALCSELNLTGTVLFPGHRSDVRLFYALADVFVLPSHSEGSPNVLLEAMAAGLPVVATAVGGVPEMATHERDVLLVEGKDVPALARSILRELTDAPLRARLGHAAQDVLRRHSPVDYFRSIRSIFQDTLKTVEKRVA
jgi:glycosyltransferase involved in cell wall biosynthesis